MMRVWRPTVSVLPNIYCFAMREFTCLYRVYSLYFREWRDIDAEQEKYLVQVMPPGDILAQSVREIVSTQNITNAAVLFDSSFGRHPSLIFFKFMETKRQSTNHWSKFNLTEKEPVLKI